MTPGKWNVERDEEGLWRVLDGYDYHRITYSTWEEAMRYAHLLAGADHAEEVGRADS